MSHVQREKNSCGPDCVGVIAAQFGISQQAVDEAFNCPDISKFTNMQDTPANHINAMRTLGLKYRTVTADMIYRGECQATRTIVLLHSVDDPKTMLPEDVLYQHWAVVEYVDVLNKRVFLDMGYEKMEARPFTFESFRARYNGFPTQTAYEITGLVAPTKPKWWVRLWCWITRKK